MKKLFVFILPFMLVVGCNDSTSEKVDIKESKVESVVSPPVVEEDMESIDTPIKDEVQEVKSEIEQEAKQEKVSGIKPETEAIPETKEKTPTASLTDTKNVESKKVYQTKQQYLQKLKEVENGLLVYEKVYENGTQSDINNAKSETFNKWDAALNEVYRELKQQLPSKEMETLREEQRKWIQQRDKKAKEESEPYRGGTMEAAQYLDTEARMTKDRVYELVNKYMK